MEKMLEDFNSYFEVNYKSLDDVISDLNTSSWFYYKYGKKLVKNYFFVDEFAGLINWSFLGRSVKLSEDFMDRYCEFLDWTSISSFQVLSEDFIRKYRGRVDWTCISERQILSEDFIREFKDKLDWELISAVQDLSFDFLEEFSDRVYWNWLCQYRIITPEFCDRFWNNIYDNLDYIIECQPFVEEYRSKFHKLEKDDIEFGGLYHLYRETKERGWFVGYVRINSRIEKKLVDFRFDINNFYFDSYPYINIFKVKVYWKDIKFTDLIDKYEILREVKCL